MTKIFSKRYCLGVHRFRKEIQCLSVRMSFFVYQEIRSNKFVWILFIRRQFLPIRLVLELCHLIWTFKQTAKDITEHFDYASNFAKILNFPILGVFMKAPNLKTNIFYSSRHDINKLIALIAYHLFNAYYMSSYIGSTW